MEYDLRELIKRALAIQAAHVLIIDHPEDFRVIAAGTKRARQYLDEHPEWVVGVYSTNPLPIDWIKEDIRAIAARYYVGGQTTYVYTKTNRRSTT